MTPPPKPLAAILVICAAVLVAFSNSLHGPFVFDDASSIVTNPTIRQLWPPTVPLSPPVTNVTAQGRPILNLSLAINYAIGGTGVWSYHALNLAIHLGAALALFGIVRRTLPRLMGGPCAPRAAAAASEPCRARNARPNSASDATWIALAVALLWAVHPLQTESVTYVIQRAESLMGLFYLLTLYGFIRGAECHLLNDKRAGRLEQGKTDCQLIVDNVQNRNRRGWFAVSVVACALGMATKEVMATAPLMVLLYDRTFVAGSFVDALRRRGKFYAALASTWLLLGWLVWQGGGNRGGSVGFGAGVEAGAYWLTQFKAIATYLRLVFWPEPLVFEYGTFWIASVGEILVPAALVFALLALTIRRLWRRPSDTALDRAALGFAGAWFFGILAPTSLAPGTTQMIVEHRMYLPLAAVLAVAVVGVYRAWGARHFTAIVIGFSAAALIAMGLTVRRNADYRTEVALWSDTVAKRPANPLAHFMLAGAWERAGDVARALASYAEALRLKPEFSVGHENFGALLLKQGRRAEAIPHFEHALRLQPEFADAHANLGNALLAEGRVAEAASHLAEAVRIAPGFFETHYNFANALAAAGRFDRAIEQYQIALKLKPEAAEAQFNLANALAELQRPAEAIEAYRVATRLRPDYAAAHYNLGNALARSGRAVDAVAAYEAALRARPDYAEAHHNLGTALFELGRWSEAARHYEETLRLAPDFPNARANLERVRARLRR